MTDKARPAADDTIVDGVPALPADTIGSSRAARSKGPDAEQGPAGEKDQPPEDHSSAQSPALSFAPPPSAQPKPAFEDPTIAYSPTPAVKPGSDSRGDVRCSLVGRFRRADWFRRVGGRPPGAGRVAVGLPGRVRVGDARPAGAFAVVPGADVPAVGYVRQELASAHDRAAARRQWQGRGGEPGRVSWRGGIRQPRHQPKRTARQAHLTVARVEPWSVMKFSFVVSLVAFVILFVAVSVLYGALAGLGVFDSLQRVVSDVTSSQGSAGVNAKAWFSASRVLGYTALLGSLNIVLITAMSTIGAVVYNLTSRLVGGVEVTLKETE